MSSALSDFRYFEQPCRPSPEPIAPLLRWVGGKQQLLQTLRALLPEDDGRTTYFEPFLGAASLFLSVQPSRAVLGDANAHLVNAYARIRDNPELVARNLRHFAREHSEQAYYRIRADYNRSPVSSRQAARFLYLNRTCFNGVFRVNQKGCFNVPHGRLAHPKFPSLDHLRRVAAIFSGATLLATSYEETLHAAKAGAFVYLDPPYPPLSATAYFVHYTTTRFSDRDQQALASLMGELDRRGCRVMLSNADTPLIRRLYKKFAITSIPVRRWVTCRAQKHLVGEVVVRNYTN